MIAADKQELETRMKQATLQIREKEMLVFTDNFAVLSTQSAFLTGLGFGGLTMSPTWTDSDYLNEAVYYTLVSVSIGFNILTLCISSWCMIFGPGLAIRGPTGSMSRAVEGMYLERRWALRFFWCGLFFVMCAGIALGWLKFQNKTAMAMSCIFGFFLITFFVYVQCVTRPRFKFPEEGSRKPQLFTLHGVNHETGEVHHQQDKMEDGAKAADMMIKQIETMRKQGLMSNDEAAEKIFYFTRLRERAELQAASQPVVTPMGPRSPPAAGGGSMSSGSTMSERRRRPSALRKMFSDTRMESAGSLAEPFDHPFAFTSNKTKSGLLSMGGRLMRVVLGNGKLTMVGLDGSDGTELVLKGKNVLCKPTPTPESPFSFTVTVNRASLQFDAKSIEDMVDWVSKF